MSKIVLRHLVWSVVFSAFFVAVGCTDSDIGKTGPPGDASNAAKSSDEAYKQMQNNQTLPSGSPAPSSSSPSPSTSPAPSSPAPSSSPAPAK